MPIQAGDKLRKVTLNLFDSDVEDLGHYYGHGWSEIVRDLVHEHLKSHRAAKVVPQTIGDLDGQRD